jgi:hypothetical protein
MFQIIFSVIWIAFVLYFAFVSLAIILKFSFFSTLIGATFLVGTYKILSTKWWAWLIQIPFLIFYGLFIYFERWNSLWWIIFLQTLVSGLLFGLYRITNPNKNIH